MLLIVETKNRNCRISVHIKIIYVGFLHIYCVFSWQRTIPDVLTFSAIGLGH